MTLLGYAVFIYAALAFAKFILAICHFPLALKVWARYHLGREARPGIGVAALLFFTVAVVSFFLVLPVLYYERQNFFSLYQRRGVIRMARGF